ncbi:MAG: hypothetical protein H7A55_17555 [Verrucomicrobiaceae bacterium]|nr:hypothetical protein [Verrucomicrobiaceae bacterium]
MPLTTSVRPVAERNLSGKNAMLEARDALPSIKGPYSSSLVLDGEIESIKGIPLEPKRKFATACAIDWNWIVEAAASRRWSRRQTEYSAEEMQPAPSRLAATAKSEACQ